MPNIEEFLRARLDEDEAGALATTPVPVPGCWKAARDKHAPDDAPLFLVQGENEYEPGSEDYSGNSPVIAYSAEWQDRAEANLRHIARHDPARVLREVEAKRRVLSDVIPEVVSCEATVRNEFDIGGTSDDEWHEGSNMLLKLMAAVYADHPDYKQSWSVS